MLTVRLSEAMYQNMNNTCRTAHLSHTEYIRKLINGRKIVIKHELIADIPQLKRLIAEFGKIGSNLNQIAHHYNSGGAKSAEMYEMTRRAISELYAMKFEVEKLGGDWSGQKRAYQSKKTKDTDKTAQQQ